MEISKAAQEELYLHIRANKKLEKSFAPAADFTRGYYAGYVMAMETEKWSEEHGAK